MYEIISIIKNNKKTLSNLNLLKKIYHIPKKFNEKIIYKKLELRNYKYKILNIVLEMIKEISEFKSEQEKLYNKSSNEFEEIIRMVLVIFSI